MLSPFSTSSKTNFLEVGGEDGSVLMKSVGGIYPVERCEKVQQLESEIAAAKRDQVSFLWGILKLSEKVAQKEGISRESARKRMFGQEEKDASASDSVSIVRKSPMEYVETEEELRLLLHGGEESEVLETLTSELKLIVATRMMSTRLAWAVFADINEVGSYQIHLARPLTFAISAGEKIKFGDNTVTVAGKGVAPGTMVIPVEAQLLEGLEGVGYLLENGKEKVGSDWNEEATKTLLLDSQIDSIYNFYQLEDAGGQDALNEMEEELSEGSEEYSEQLGNSSVPLIENPLPQESTGAKSSIDSTPPVAKIGG